MMLAGRWLVVKISRTGCESVMWVSWATEEDAIDWAAELNARYQTDEYHVQQYDPNRQGTAL